MGKVILLNHQKKKETGIEKRNKYSSIEAKIRSFKEKHETVLTSFHRLKTKLALLDNKEITPAKIKEIQIMVNEFVEENHLVGNIDVHEFNKGIIMMGRTYQDQIMLSNLDH